MAALLGIERESVYRLEREWLTRMTPQKQSPVGGSPRHSSREFGICPAVCRRSTQMVAEIDDNAIETMIADIVARLIADRILPSH